MARKRHNRKKRPKEIKPGLSAISKTRRRRLWRTWVWRIRGEIGDLLDRKQVFVTIRSVVHLNDRLGEPNLLVHWMVQNHVEATTVGIRRICDTRDDVVSLSRLLRQLLEYPDVLDLAYYRRRCPTARRKTASTDFQLLARTKRATLSERIIRGDLRRIENLAARIQRFVNRRIAHAAPPHQFGRAPTYGDLGRMVSELDRIAVRYLCLLTGEHHDTCVPARQRDWRSLLLEAWIGDLGSLQTG